MSGENMQNLVKINSRKALSSDEGGAENSVSRRSFLKVLGATTAVGLTGCADDHTTKILPYVRGEADQIPGVSVWYRSTCTECSAGCGVMVKTREGRAIKVEGSLDSPINQGGLCALGQSSLQNLYDPDRVRQPIQRNAAADSSGRKIFERTPIDWDGGLKLVASKLKEGGKKKALVTGELSGATEELVRSFCEAYGVTHVVYDALQPVAVAKAHEVVFGSYGIPHYRLDKAEVILNFGADFLETFVSPVEFARAWAKGRKGERPTKFIQIEPRLSLSGSNADLWLTAKPGSEIQIALFLIKSLLETGRGDNLPAATRIRMLELVKGVDVDSAANGSGISKEKLLVVARALKDARSSLVLAGGASVSTADPLPLQVACCFLNLLLDNVGSSVDMSQLRKPRSSASGLKELCEQLEKGGVELLMVYGANPAFSAPSSYGFETSRNSAPLMVSFSSHLDETSELADLVLPSHTGLESWGDVRPYTGVYSLMQPVMKPVFDTRQFGDILLALAAAAGKSIAKEESFELFLKGSWQKLQSQLGVAGDFNRFWLECVERGGYFAPESNSQPKVTIAGPEALSGVFASAQFDDAGTPDATASNSLVVLPYFSVRTFDGRAANRPWLQELPDPVTTAVWDSWAEIHPETAARLGLKKNDMVTVRNQYGEVNVGVYLSQYVHRDVVAIPVGQGHTAYGRYAKEVGGSGNVFGLIPATAAKGVGSLPLLSTTAYVSRGRGKAELLILSGSDSQLGRDIARSEKVAVAAYGVGTSGLQANAEANEAAKAAHAGHKDAGHKDGGHGDAGHHGDAHGGDHHGPIKQMYQQREHPLYAWGMAIDLAACTGCSACVVACYAENNIPVVGRQQVYKGREMSWLRIERYYDGSAEELQVDFLPMMCQHCGNAPCEPVCPVYATYHNEEGMNAMIYNRCVGTRYCANNCSYKVRRFNWHDYDLPEPLNWQLNPDVTKRTVGVMEKCSFCVQRIAEAKDHAKDEGRLVRDGEVQPACVQGCPTKALTFGNLNDPESEVSKKSKDRRAYKVLDKWINTQPAVSYLKRTRVEV